MNIEQLTKWNAVKIGALSWFVPTILLFSLPLGVTYAGSGIYGVKDLAAIMILPIVVVSPGLPVGIAGALAGRFLRKSRRATWIGAVTGTILGFWISIQLLSLLFSLYGWDPFAGL